MANFTGHSKGIPLKEFLESLDVPIFLVDSDVRVRGATSTGVGLAGWETEEETQGLLVGEVFHCVNAKLPGGCGQTGNCSACILRNTVTETYRSGEARVRVPGVLTVRRGEEVAELPFHLTTVKVGDRVLVRVDHREAAV